MDWEGQKERLPVSGRWSAKFGYLQITQKWRFLKNQRQQNRTETQGNRCDLKASLCLPEESLKTRASLRLALPSLVQTANGHQVLLTNTQR